MHFRLIDRSHSRDVFYDVKFFFSEFIRIVNDIQLKFLLYRYHVKVPPRPASTISSLGAFGFKAVNKVKMQYIETLME